MNMHLLRCSLVAVVAAVALLGLCAPAPAYEGNLEIEMPRLTMFYQPPQDRGSLANLLVLQREVEQLNLVAAVINNYLNHLIHLRKVSSLPRLSIEYAPGAEKSGVGEAGRLLLHDLGLQNALDTVNAWLTERAPETSRSLLTQREHVFDLSRAVPLASGTVEDGFSFDALSDRIPELAPEGDFAVLPDRRIVVSRPTAGMNRLLCLPIDARDKGRCLVPPGQYFYTGVRASADGKWLFFLAGEQAMVASTASGSPIELFPRDEGMLFLDGSWSPVGAKFVGVLQKKDTGARRLFLFDGDKGKLMPFFDDHPEIEADYQFPWPCWSPFGQQFLLSTGNEISLCDLANNRVLARVVKLPQTEATGICEMLWAPDGRCFYFSTTTGMSRDKRIYDSGDFRGAAVVRVDLTDGQGPVERPLFVGKGFVKLLQVCQEGRLVFLHGRMKTQRYRSPLWTFDGVSAYATPVPGSPTATAPTPITLKYVYALRNLESKFANIVDAGQHRANLQFCDEQATSWFIGTDMASGPMPIAATFDMRQPPYPFGERNRVYCLGLEASVVKPFLDFLAGYRIIRFELDADLRRVYFLSNTRGQMTAWSGRLDHVCEVKFAQPKSFNVDAEDEGAGEAADPGLGTDLPPSASILPPALPGTGAAPASPGGSTDQPPAATILPPVVPPSLPVPDKKSSAGDDGGFGDIPKASVLPPPALPSTASGQGSGAR